MRHRIVLYNPPAVFWTMPLALVAVGSSLDPNRFQVAVVDGRLLSTDRLLAELDGALCLGVTVLTGAPLGEALTVSRQVRRRYPRLPIIWGGWHPSLFPTECAAEPSVTAAVIGQGEQTFAALVDRLADGRTLEDIAGCITYDASVGNGDRVGRPLADINLFRRHDYDLIDVEAYFDRKGRRQLDYVTSQGCRFRCGFCADPAVFGRGWFGLEPDRVVDELGDLHARYGLTDLGYQDETFFTSSRRVAEIANGILVRDLRFTWYATLRADQGRRMDDALFALCRESGLRDVVLGLESGSPETLARIHKDISLDDMWDTATKLVRHGIGANIGIIVGFPGEPEQSVLASLGMARELRRLSPDFNISVFRYKPYPGSPITDQLGRQGYRFPDTLESWARFDYVGGRSDWLSRPLHQLVENFTFYQKLAYDRPSNALERPLRALARWRVEHDAYAMPIERRIIEHLHARPRLS